MTLDEAIKDREEAAKKAEKLEFKLCAEEHKQLAEWLKELKRQREAWKNVKAEIEKLKRNEGKWMFGDDLPINWAVSSVLIIIDKHLREVTTDADRD